MKADLQAACHRGTDTELTSGFEDSHSLIGLWSRGCCVQDSQTRRRSRSRTQLIPSSAMRPRFSTACVASEHTCSHRAVVQRRSTSLLSTMVFRLDSWTGLPILWLLSSSLLTTTWPRMELFSQWQRGIRCKVRKSGISVPRTTTR